EAVLGLFVARIAVGMILHGELTERLLDVVARGITPHAEQLIEVLFRHRNYLVPRLRTPGASSGEVDTGSPWKMRPSLGAFSGEVDTDSPWKMRPSLPGAFSGEVATGSPWKMRPSLPGAFSGEVATGSPWKMRPSLPGAFSGEVATGSPWKMRPSLQRQT